MKASEAVKNTGVTETEIVLLIMISCTTIKKLKMTRLKKPLWKMMKVKNLKLQMLLKIER